MTQKLKVRVRRDPVQWANESLEIARGFVYAGVPVSNEPVTITEDYVAKAGVIVYQRLAQAGIRLADVLKNFMKQPRNVTKKV